MIGKGNGLVMDRTRIHGSNNNRHGVLRVLDENMVRGGNMGIVVVILIITIIVWYPWKGGRK